MALGDQPPPFSRPLLADDTGVSFGLPKYCYRCH